MKRISCPSLMLSAVVLAGLIALPAPRGDAAPEPADTPIVSVSTDATASEARTRTYSRADLRSFVIAAVQIDRVIRQRREHAASDASGSRNRAMRARIHRIIEATPRLDPARYRAIAEAVRMDPVLRTRVRQVIQALRNEKHDALQPLTADTF
ncbi:hypothetical protein CKO28_24745 [Rhodovibrio sodomensis]|uniref:DUF4168 domain-containing protein n=1 Tax=Rhodovibrio sodomensis TaxID=1088 RepID=A0ABS1DL28_9PROT|nr:DUF4168 domain-containing protein [Rhodovibrio sodomensis]MBK1671214.1 hypothetical protein [Rhodovibrio sodomensis]